MRDLFVSALVVGCLPTCFRRPFIGLLLFSVLAYMRIQDLTWGFARFQRWSFYVAIITFAGYAFAGAARRNMLPDIRNWLMIGLMVFVGLSLVMNGPYDARGDTARYVEYLKIVGIAIFTTAVVKDRHYLRVLVWVIALSFGFFGVKNGISFILSGGGLKIIQGPGGMLADNNDFALALCMGVPLLFHLGWAERRKLMRRTMLAMVPLTMLTVVATHSRGAFLAMTCSVLVLVWRSKNRVGGFATLVLVAIAGMIAAPASYYERIATIGTYEEDQSARGRLEAWAVAGNMIVANPMFGVGFDKFTRNYRAYDLKSGPATNTPDTGIHVAHNSYLQIWAECGTPAMILYLLLIAFSYFDLWRVRKMARERYHASWILSYATMLEASLTAFVVGSVFLNRAQFDLFYHFVAVIMMFGHFARMEMKQLHVDPAPAREGGRRAPLQVARERGIAREPAIGGFERAGGRSGFGRGPALGGT
jgi:probable O-glycosylation ligase (exosortase A-associated)